MKLLQETPIFGSDAEAEEARKRAGFAEGGISRETGNEGQETQGNRESRSLDTGEAGAPPVTPDFPGNEPPVETGGLDQEAGQELTPEQRQQALVTEENLEHAVLNLSVDETNAAEIVKNLTEMDRLNDLLTKSQEEPKL